MSNNPLQKNQSDDIDDLLDNVERKYFSPEAQKLSQIAPKDCECTKKQETNWTEVDEILKDFVFEDTNPFGKHKNNSWIRSDIQAPPSAVSSSKGKKGPEEIYLKCFRILLAGSYEQMGHCEIGRERYVNFSRRYYPINLVIKKWNSNLL